MLLAHSRVLRAIESDLEAAGTIPLTWYDVLLELYGAGGRLRMQVLGDRVVLSRTRSAASSTNWNGKVLSRESRTTPMEG